MQGPMDQMLLSRRWAHVISEWRTQTHCFGLLFITYNVIKPENRDKSVKTACMKLIGKQRLEQNVHVTHFLNPFLAKQLLYNGKV